MLLWIFDLDYTLYNIPKDIQFKHSYLKKDNYLGILLSFLPNKKLIFTNSNKAHCELSLNLIGIIGNFDTIMTKDDNTLKPDLSSYVTFIKKNKITKNDRCIFFEDTEENLRTAKLFGWTTVFIGYINTRNYIDYSFNTIHDALEYFVKHS